MLLLTLYCYCSQNSNATRTKYRSEAILVSCLIYAQALLEYVCNFILLLIVWVRSFSKMLPSVKFAEDKVLVLVILHKNAKIVQL